MELKVVNISDHEVYLADFYISIPAGKFIEVSRPRTDIESLRSLQAALARNEVMAVWNPTEDELQSGVLERDRLVTAATTMPVSVTEPMAAIFSIRILVRARQTEVFAAGCIPFRFRVLSAQMFAHSGIGKAQILTGLEGSVTCVAAFDFSNATLPGMVWSLKGSAVVDASERNGLFVIVEDTSVEGEILMLCRREL